MLDKIDLPVLLYCLSVPGKGASWPVGIPRHPDLQSAATAGPKVYGEVVAIERNSLTVLGYAHELMLRVCAPLDNDRTRLYLVGVH